MDNPWPAEIPWSLWSYQSLSATDVPQVPMMGIKFAPGFIYAFAFGCIFVVFFSWQRFRRRDESVKASSEALRELQPTDLGGRNALLRAYFIYAGAMLILYVSLTFFGKLIFQATQMIPVAGISVDVAQLKFDSPQWPLTLAFAFAGLADLLPPVRLAEGWLRNRAYRAAGIPVRLEHTMRSLIATLEEPSKGETAEVGNKDPKSKAGSLAHLLGRYSADWKAQIEKNPRAKALLARRISRSEELVSLLSQIELLAIWAKTARGSWPGAEVSFRVRETEAELVNKADKLLNDFQRWLNEMVEPAQIEAKFSLDQFDQHLSDVVQEARSIRLELVSVLAIFIERDPDVPAPKKGADPGHPKAIDALADLLQETDRPDSVGNGPEAGLLVLLVPVFIIFSASAWQGAQELVGQYVETTNFTGVLLTALLETLKIASLTWLPLLAAFSLRQYLWDTGDWAGTGSRIAHRSSSRLSQMMACLGLALAVSLIGLTGVALLRAFVIAQNGNYFNSLLFGGANPFMLYYPSLAVTVIPLIPLCLLAADERAKGRSVLLYAIICAFAVLLVSVLHGMFWDEDWANKCFQMSTITSSECTRRSDTLSRLMLFVLAFLATWILGGPAPSREHHWSIPQSARMAASLTVLAIFVLASPLLAGERKTVVVGFRDDLEPFSYLIDNGGPAHHIGYLADLCYKIFEGSDYQIAAMSVTARNRFRQINWEEKDRIDLLCDAITMQFEDESVSADKPRSWNSIYSPIVFASGVSFLDRSARGATTKGGDVAIGYVYNTTAPNVALKSCEVDLFKALPPTQRKATYERCHFLYGATRVRQKIGEIIRGDARVPDAGKVISEAFAAAQAVITNSDQLPGKGGLPSLPSYAIAMNFLDILKKECPQNTNIFDANCIEEFSPEDLQKVDQALKDPDCAPLEREPLKEDEQQVSWREYHFCPMENHQDLIRWLCEDSAGTRRVYMGDRELILGKLESWNAKNAPCIVEQPNGAEYLTYEPYALLVSKNDPELVQFVQRRIYQIFSHRATATALFASYFPQRTMSSALAYLFLLNAVEPEESYLMPTHPTKPEH